MSAAPFLLIDADVLAYQAAAGAEKTLRFEEDTCFPCCSLTDALAVFDAKLSAVLDDVGTEDYILAFSDSADNNFRRALFPPYKMNRAGKPRPVILSFLRQALMEEHTDRVCLRPTLEADDCLGILATRASFQPGWRKIIASIDKDLKTVPGFFYDINKPEQGVQEVGQEEADYRHMIQTLTGDASDGYPGCPKYGVVTAGKLLDGVERTYESMWPLVLAAYAKAGFGEEYALTQARVARILRAEDYDFNHKKVKLWKM